MQNPKLITGKLKEWVIITMIVVKTIDAKSPSLKLMAASAEPCSSLLARATTIASVIVQS